MTRTLFALCLCGVALADTVVLRDRTVLEGAATRAGDVLEIAGAKVPVDEVLLWEDGAGVAQIETPLFGQLEAYRILADRAALGTCLDRLPKAAEAGAGRSARALLARAEALGLDPREAERWDAKLEPLGDTEGDFPVPGRDVLAGMLVERARANGGGDGKPRGLELLQAALQRDAEHEGARKYLAELAPAKWAIGDARVWLDWAVDVLQGDARVLQWRNPDMARARTIFAKDVHGVETPEIVFITQMQESGPVAMCLKYARLACTALDRMFATPNPAREETLPLVVYFYKDKKDYVNLSGAGQGLGPQAALGLTLGHYSPNENVSRFFWPDAPDAERSVRDTFVHELTHHWIQRRCPRWHARDTDVSGGRVQVPGYWIVEGFAVFVQEGRYDIRKGTWSHFNPHARSIDVTAALSKKGELIPWDKVYPLNQVEFNTQLDKSKSHAQFQTKWALAPQGIFEIRLFYEQSGATCHFLYWGEKGRYREQLLDYVTAFYTSNSTRTSIETAFGMTPKELGEKVEKWCHEVMAGWRP